MIPVISLLHGKRRIQSSKVLMAEKKGGRIRRCGNRRTLIVSESGREDDSSKMALPEPTVLRENGWVVRAKSAPRGRGFGG